MPEYIKPKIKHPKPTPEQIEKILSLYLEEQIGIATIANHIGVAYNNVREVLYSKGVIRPKTAGRSGRIDIEKRLALMTHDQRMKYETKKRLFQR
jgi:hypothetical protein